MLFQFRFTICRVYTNGIPSIANMLTRVTTVPSGAEIQEATVNGSVNISDRLEEKILEKQRFCSFEAFSGPDTTEETYQRLFATLEPCLPLFYSITWHSSTCNIPTEIHPSLKYFENYSNITLLHLPARGLSRRDVIHVLNRALRIGKTNIFALQGDFDDIDSELNTVDFPYAVDLVKFIRSEFGSKFSICVAGYPQMHPRSISKETDLFYLKAKIDAGANFIITQIIFESKVFTEFVKDCRRAGITVPIIPAIFPFSSYKSLINITKICKTKIPKRILQDLDFIKNDDDAVKQYGINLSTVIVKEIFESGTASGVHLITLNRSQSALELCKRLNICKV